MLDPEKVINKVSIPKRSSSNVNEKEKSKKRKKIVEDDSETFLTGMIEVMKNFTDIKTKELVP